MPSTRILLGYVAASIDENKNIRYLKYSSNYLGMSFTEYAIPLDLEKAKSDLKSMEKLISYLGIKDTTCCILEVYGTPVHLKAE